MSITISGTPPIGTASVTGTATLLASDLTGYTSASLLCSSTGGAFTITLPKPTDLARAFRLTLVDVAGTAASHPVAILNSASTVQGIAISTALHVLSFANAAIVLTTDGLSDAWTIAAAAGPPDQVYSWSRVTNQLVATVNGTSYVSGIVPYANHAVTADSISGGGAVGAVPQCVKITKTHTDLAIAATTNNITLYSLPAGGVIQMVKTKASVAFTGGSISAYTVSVGIAGTLAKYSTAFDVFQAVGSDTYQLSALFGGEDCSSPTAIKIAATSTGANLSAATAGSVDIWLLVSVAV